jgi:hypothetical protein
MIMEPAVKMVFTAGPWLGPAVKIKSVSHGPAVKIEQ